MVSKKLLAVILTVTLAGGATAAFLVFSSGPAPPSAGVSIRKSFWSPGFVGASGLRLDLVVDINNTGKEPLFLEPRRFNLELSDGENVTPSQMRPYYSSGGRDECRGKLDEFLPPVSGATYCLSFWPLWPARAGPIILEFGYEWEGKVSSPVPRPENEWPAQVSISIHHSYWTDIFGGNRSLELDTTIINKDEHELLLDRERFRLETSKSNLLVPVSLWKFSLQPEEAIKSLTFRVPIDEEPAKLLFQPFWGDEMSVLVPSPVSTTEALQVSISRVVQRNYTESFLMVDLRLRNFADEPVYVNLLDQLKLKTTSETFYKPERSEKPTVLLAPKESDEYCRVRADCWVITVHFAILPGSAPDELQFGWPWEDAIFLSFIAVSVFGSTDSGIVITEWTYVFEPLRDGVIFGFQFRNDHPSIRLKATFEVSLLNAAGETLASRTFPSVVLLPGKGQGFSYEFSAPNLIAAVDRIVLSVEQEPV